MSPVSLPGYHCLLQCIWHQAAVLDVCSTPAWRNHYPHPLNAKYAARMPRNQNQTNNQSPGGVSTRVD